MGSLVFAGRGLDNLAVEGQLGQVEGHGALAGGGVGADGVGSLPVIEGGVGLAADEIVDQTAQLARMDLGFGILCHEVFSF